MKLIRLLVGLCAGLVGWVLLIGSVLFTGLWFAFEADKDWSFLVVFALALGVSALLILFARWCFKRREEDESLPAPPAPLPLAPPPLPIPDSVAALGDVGLALFALNNEDLPFQIVAGDGQEADLIAEWKVVDVKWHESLKASGIQKVFRIFLKLDPAAREVRTFDREYELTWHADLPVLHGGKVAHAGASAQVFRGRMYKKEYHAVFRAEDVLESLLGLLRGKWVPPKPIYEYKFNTSEIKTPIMNAVAKCGWAVRQLAFGDL
jgi:hypothetical protein